MEVEKAIDQGSNRWSNKVIVIGFVSLLFGSNILNSYINTQYHNTLKIEENDKSAAKRLKHAIEKQDYKNSIKDLTKELADCNKNK